MNLFNGGLDGSHARDRLIEASHELGSAIRGGRARMARQAAASMDYARGLTDEALSRGREVGRSARGVVADRPLEALLIVGLASFACGWILRHMRQDPASAPSRARARPPRSSRRR